MPTSFRQILLSAHQEKSNLDLMSKFEHCHLGHKVLPQEN